MTKHWLALRKLQATLIVSRRVSLFVRNSDAKYLAETKRFRGS